MQKENSKLKEYADYIMRCDTLEEVMKGIAIGISSSIYDNDIQKEALDYLEKNRTTTYEVELPEGMKEEEASKILVKEKDDKKFQEEWKLEKEMIKNRQVCETCKHWQVGNSEFCLKKFICHLPHHTCLNWKEGIKAEYYPYPPNATLEEIEEIIKKHIEEWKDYLEKR